MSCGVKKRSSGGGIESVNDTGVESSKFLNGVCAIEDCFVAGVCCCFASVSETRSLANSRISSSSLSCDDPCSANIAVHVRDRIEDTSPSLTIILPNPVCLSYANVSCRFHREWIFSSASVIKAIANSPLPKRKNSRRRVRTSTTFDRGRSFCNVVWESERRIEAMMFVKSDALMGYISEESCFRCFVRTGRSSDDVPDVFLTLI